MDPLPLWLAAGAIALAIAVDRYFFAPRRPAAPPAAVGVPNAEDPPAAEAAPGTRDPAEAESAPRAAVGDPNAEDPPAAEAAPATRDPAEPGSPAANQASP